MANLIKIKRSSATATPTSLNEGELAFSYLSGKLYIGNSSAVIPIGGTHNPGILTANQALVANATSQIDKIIVANLNIKEVWANGAVGTAGYVLASAGAGANAYWVSPSSLTTSAAGSNTQIQFNNSGAFGADANLTFNTATSKLTIGNSTVNAAINSTSVDVDGNITGHRFISSNVSLSAPVNGTYDGERLRLYDFGDGRVNYSIGAEASHVWTAVDQNANSQGFKWYGNTVLAARLGGTGTLEIKSDFYTDASVNANVSVKVGSNVVANTSALLIGNSTVGTVITSTSITGNGANITSVDAATVGGNTAATLRSYSDTVAATAYSNATSYADTKAATAYSNATSYADTKAATAYSNATSYADTKAATAYSNAIAYSSNADNITSGTLNTARLPATVNVATAINVGANVNLSTSQINVGNSTVNTVITSSGITTTGSANVGTNLTVSGNLVVNGNVQLGDSFGVDVTSFKSTVNTEISPSSNNSYNLGRSDLRWGSVNANNVLATNVAVDSVVTVGSNVSLSTGVLSIGNSTVNTVVNSTSVSTGSLTVANLSVTGDLEVQGNTKLGNATSDVVSFIGKVNTHIIPSANLTYSLGNNTLYWAEVHTGNVHADYAYFNQDVAIYGDLTITGNLVTSNVTSVVISDPLIYLAGNNYVSDLVDIGFVGNYHTGGQDLHTGLFRDASVDQYYLFKGLTQELDGVLTVNTADPTFALADLNAWLLSGALVSNSLAVTITANSTVNVNITANSLSLSSALAVGSGGTGLSSVTAKGILYGNTTGPLGVTSAGTDGQVLQANSTGYPVFADLDGGTF